MKRNRKYPGAVRCTKWFPADVKPVHKGVYELEPEQGDLACDPKARTFAYWSGRGWCLSQTSTYDSAFDAEGMTAIRRAGMVFQKHYARSKYLPNPRWRGMKEPASDPNRDEREFIAAA